MRETGRADGIQIQLIAGPNADRLGLSVGAACAEGLLGVLIKHTEGLS